MNISQQRQRSKQSNKSALSKGWHDFRSPLGTSIIGIIVVCGMLSVIIDYIGEYFDIPQSKINIIIMIIIAIAVVTLVTKVSSATKEATRKRKEAYEQKFGGNRKNGRPK